MKKYLLIFFFTFTFVQLFASQNKPTLISKGCNYHITNDYVKEIDNLKIKLIEVDVHDFRKWTINGVRILTNRYRYVPEKYKKRYDATVTVTYENDNKCILSARIRHSGDEKDHIDQLDNSITQSLDVHLNEGNIRGITKFKLFRPNTRGNLEDEILITEILRNLNFIAPRSIKIKTRVNKVSSTMLFQEKAAKEMLENNKRREGPILEADERFFYKAVSQIEDNNLSGWDMGVVPLMNQSSKYMLSKQVNTNILEKSHNHKKMSLQAVANLNLIYLYFSSRFQDELNNFNYFEYDLDNTLLGFFNEQKISKLNEYNLLMQSTNSTHGLAANNRKFYWNSIENYFEPINYDSNAKINSKFPETSYRYPMSENFYDSFVSLKKKLNQIDVSDVKRNLGLSGLDYTKGQLKKKIQLIISNLEKLEKNYLKNTTKELVEHNKTKELDDILVKFHKNLNANHPDTYLIKNNIDINDFQKCEIFLEKCFEVNFTIEELSNLLEGELTKDKSPFQYLGNNFNFKSSLQSYKFKKFKESLIFFEEGISLNYNEENNYINIEQNIKGAKVYIINGELKKTIINFKGFEEQENRSNKIFGFPINVRGLTGCLSLINLKIKDIILNSINSSCEDSINLINTIGNIDSISIDNSYSDALDIDFSNVQIKNININNAKNDCVDLSYGDYKIDNFNLSNCGDKALSVGEKSILKLKNFEARNSTIGIASKDSSIIHSNKITLNSVDTCLEAYKKKQEFEGGIINFNNMDCNFSQNKLSADEYSIITELNNNKKNEL
tara:strand:- start:857 stop:3205 length:2349 start_codon:yes stop_codon:yes gene_type:complete